MPFFFHQQLDGPEGGPTEDIMIGPGPMTAPLPAPPPGGVERMNRVISIGDEPA